VVIAPVIAPPVFCNGSVSPEPPVTPTGNTPVVICVALIPVGVPENYGEAFLA